MKVAIIGGAGVRVPMLVRALAASDLAVTDIDAFGKLVDEAKGALAS